MRSSSILGLLSVVLPFALANLHGPQAGRRHQELAYRARGEVQQLNKRYDGARFTFYKVGLGACGVVNVPSDFIVALNSEQFGTGYPAPECFQTITIACNGKTTQAMIMDECPGCPFGGLDMSSGLFDFFALESVGVLSGSWWFNDGHGETTTNKWTPTSSWVESTASWADPSTSTWDPPTTTQPPTTWDTPSDTWVALTTTSTTTWSPSTTPTTSWTPSTTSTTSTSTSTSVPYTSGTLAVPTGTVSIPAPAAGNPQNLLTINEALIDIGALAVAASRLSKHR